MARKKLLHTPQRNKSKQKRKRGWIIFGGIVTAVIVISYITNLAEQSRLEKDNVPIVFSNVEDDIRLDHRTNKHEISAKISGISSFAEVKVSGNKLEIHDRKDSAGNIRYEIKDVKEGDSDIFISVVDGKRRGDKTIKLHRQTKADYDKQELEKALKSAEESIKKAEEQPTDDAISRARSDINKLPNDRRTLFSERIAKLEKARQAEKERTEKAQKEAEEKKRQEEAAAVARTHQQQHGVPNSSSAARQQITPAPAAPRPSNNLPFKAICKDGSIQYQDSPSVQNYRGMCSSHGGIAKKLGRVP